MRNVLLAASLVLSLTAAGLAAFLFLDRPAASGAPGADADGNKQDGDVLARRIDDLGRRLDDLEARPAEPHRVELDALRDRVDLADLRLKTASDLAERVALVEGQVRSATTAAETARRKGDEAQVTLQEFRAGYDADKEKIRTEVQKLAETQGERREWKPPLAEFARELALDARQTQAVEKVLRAKQQALADMLRQAGPDGKTGAQILATAFTDPDPMKKQTALFELLSRKVPQGQGETYGAAVGALQGEIWQEFERELTPDQVTDIRARNTDLFGIDIPDAPLGAALQEAIQQLQQKEE